MTPSEERAKLINAVEWLALELHHHPATCTCGSCQALAHCADIIEAKNSKYIATRIQNRLCVQENTGPK